MVPRTVLLRANDEIETLNYSGFRDRLASHLADGRRVLSCFGTPQTEAPTGPPVLHAIVLGLTGLEQFCGRGTPGDEFPSLSALYPQMHCFEREIHEQFGLSFPGHPWLKPIRYEGRNLGRMDDYPFYQLAGKEVHEVGVGPIHAGVIEPGHFRFMCYGETVHHLEIQLGYQHRGVETLLTKTPPRKLPPLVESIAGDTAVPNVVAFCRAWESLCGVPTRPGVEAVRGIAIELERIAMHLVGVGGLATDVAFLPGSSTYGRLRTAIINLSMRLCGSRFGRSWFRPGELRYPFGPKEKDDVRATLQLVRRDLALINDLFGKSQSVRHRLETTGTVPTALARDIGMVGMAARASGLTCDLRNELPAGVYQQHAMPLVTEPAGDCQARAVVRLREMDESLSWLLRVIEDLPDVGADPPALLKPRANSTAVSFEEGWRGEVMHAIRTDAQGQIAHYKVQDPSLRNWFGLAQAVRDNAIYDFPICNKSFDLSYCGNDL
ncbi:MAG: hydrogenase [Planctomycetaceae bacterium]|nr:hydrogenase [Planctomycetaceae bacterium]